MMKNSKARWLALALAASCTGCATGSGAKSPGYFASWTNPFASLASGGNAKPKEEDDALRRENKIAPQADFFLAAGALAESRGDNNAAINQYEQAIKTEPKNVKSHLHLARLYDRLQQYPEAEKAYQNAISAGPTDPMPLNDYAMCLARQGRYDESISEFHKAISLRKHQTLYRNNMAEVLVKAGRAQEAYEHLAVVHSVAESHYNLGLLLRRNGEIAPARQQFMAALQIDPQFTAAEEVLAELGQPHPQSTVRQATRPAAKEVGAPRHLRAQAPQEAMTEAMIEADEAPPVEAMPTKQPGKQGGYYEGLQEGDQAVEAPAEVLAKKPTAKPARKSASELRAKIEDSEPRLR